MKTFPAILNSLSTIADDEGTLKNSLANKASTGNFFWLSLQKSAGFVSIDAQEARR